MDSSELYHVKQQFILGAYKALANSSLPDPSSPDYAPTLIYQTRARIALDDCKTTNIPPDSENLALKAVAALARYVSAVGIAEQEVSLEELRDLCVEIEGDDVERNEQDKDMVKVLSGTAFARAGEVEEALETLGAGSSTENLEAIALIVQVYLSINRPDLAKKEFERSKRWAEDDLLLQLIEASIGFLTGKDSYSNCNSFYTEQLGNPSLTSPHLLTARGVTRLLRNEIHEAKSDLEDSLSQQSDDAETLAAYVVAAGLGATKKAEADELWSRLTGEHPEHPLVVDVTLKAELFDECALKFEVPSLAIP
jgi:coatomer protein complex subunit epsilon